MFCESRYSRKTSWKGLYQEKIDKPRFLTTGKGKVIMSIVIWKMADLFWSDRTVLDNDAEVGKDWQGIFQQCISQLQSLEVENTALSGVRTTTTLKKAIAWFKLFYNTGYVYCPHDLSVMKDDNERAKCCHVCRRMMKEDERG